MIANQSLHHVVALETLFDEIKRSLRPEGYFITSDMIGRNGHQRWPEAFRAVQRFWKELPVEYRHNRTFERYEEEYLEHDCSIEGFEGIRAQDILPLLVERFDFHLFVAFGNIVNVFLDRRFGPNFDAGADWDRGFIDRVHAFDEEGLRRGELTPTQMFAVLTTEPCSEHLSSRGLTPAECIRKADADEALRSDGLTVTTTSIRPRDEGGTLYQQQWEAAGGRPPYRWSAEDLPPDLMLSSSGLLTGRLRAPGVFTPRIEVLDGSSPPLVADQRYTVVVKDEQIAARLRISSPAQLPSGVVGQRHSQQLYAVGGRPPYAWSLVGEAPVPGLELDASSGLLTGVPADAGVFRITVQVADIAGEAVASDHVLTVRPDLGRQRLVLPQIASGSGWRTHLHLVNPSPSEAEVTISFRSKDGSALDLSTVVDGPGREARSCVGEVRETIGPRSSIRIATPVKPGWCRRRWDGRRFFTRVRFPAMRSFEQQGSPSVTAELVATLGSSLLLPFDNTGGCKVGVALMNGDASAPASVEVTIWDKDWSPLHTASFDLAPGGHLSFMLAERYPAAAGCVGLIEFRTAAQGQIGGLGLQYAADGRFASIPRLADTKPV